MSPGNNWRIKIRCERIRSYSGIFYKTTKRLVACIQMHLASFWPRQPLHREGKKNRPFQSVVGERYFERKVFLKMESKLMPDPSGRRRHILKLFWPVCNLCLGPFIVVCMFSTSVIDLFLSCCLLSSIFFFFFHTYAYEAAFGRKCNQFRVSFYNQELEKGSFIMQI